MLVPGSDPLAANAARVSSVVRHLPAYLDRMIEAADRGDWQEIHVLSSALATGSGVAGVRELSGAATQLAAASQGSGSPPAIRRSLLRLIGIGGRTRRSVQRWATPSEASSLAASNSRGSR